MCVHSCACTNVHACGGQRSMLGVFLNCFPPYFLRQYLLLNLELDWLSHQAQDSSSLPPHCQDVEGPGLLGWPWGPKLKFSRLLGKLSLPTELSSKRLIFENKGGAGEMTQQWRSLAAFLADPNSVPSIRMATHYCNWTVPGEIWRPLLDFAGTAWNGAKTYT